MSLETIIDRLPEPPRKRGRPYAGGRDPILAARAPIALIEAVKAKASKRRASVGVIVREALEAYVGAPADKDRAA
jgi:hypothetical protein